MVVPQMVFVRSRAGLGYDGSQTGSSSDEKDKLVIELRQRVETLDQALHACKGSNQFFKDKGELNRFQLSAEIVQALLFAELWKGKIRTYC